MFSDVNICTKSVFADQITFLPAAAFVKKHGFHDLPTRCRTVQATETWAKIDIPSHII